MRLGQTAKQVARRDNRRFEFARRAAAHRDEAWAKALQAGKILVAVRLIDLPLAAEFGLDRLHRDAIGFVRAVAAALADGVVDKNALRRFRQHTALAVAALL